MYELMKDASINGMVNRIAKKLNKSIEELNNDIFKSLRLAIVHLGKVYVAIGKRELLILNHCD